MRGKRIVTWLLVADGARAEILTADHVNGGIRPILVKEFETGHSRTSELVSDRPGRLADGPNGGVHAAGKTDWHVLNKRRFVREIAGAVSDAALAGSFDRLVLIAPPKILGDLRGDLHKEARKRVVAEIPKDLVGVRPHDLLANRDIPLVA